MAHHLNANGCLSLVSKWKRWGMGTIGVLGNTASLYLEFSLGLDVTNEGIEYLLACGIIYGSNEGPSSGKYAVK